MKSYKFIISGKVQGVFYRKSVTNNANRANFSGYIKNLPNGDVEAVVTCKENRLNEFITILKSGSEYSKISNIKQTSIGTLFSNKFEIRY
ncbi:acylphosphatase [Arcobacter nitrofigilis DSM 7299]|uniref:acylphosphatase n=1 Tax=Arcobacter nitrofigilis (strain ATCC 33309 / DSM 7299 / CCUG 15893 / LMG 7604 / NCTC 12251 / CI) TaxID=572480 RepID=D5V547_ARCNC|nr:acylphosphatase [Arcobacter nitrofigilis]ADG92009.1 acylphosphatase [Arcobacter nitrofigilis DSM 7299]